MIREGLIAGAAGTLAIAALGPLESRLLGHEPIYAPRRLAAALAGRWATNTPGEGATRVAGVAMRAVYGPSWGLLFAAMTRRAPRRVVRAGLVLGAAICAFEELAMPRVGATPPSSTWTTTEHALLLVQTAVFGLVCTGTLAALGRG